MNMNRKPIKMYELSPRKPENLVGRPSKNKGVSNQFPSARILSRGFRFSVILKLG